MAKRKTAALAVSRLDEQMDGIEPRIFIIRGQKVLLDRDLAGLYEVNPIALRQQVRRNPNRFPSDSVFKLNNLEVESMVSQNVIPSRQVLGGSMPSAFTEQGIAMLSSVLTSDRAIEVNLIIMRTFVKMRKLLAGHEELARRLDEIGWTQSEHSEQIQSILNTIQELVYPTLSDVPRRQIGFSAGA